MGQNVWRHATTVRLAGAASGGQLLRQGRPTRLLYPPRRPIAGDERRGIVLFQKCVFVWKRERGRARARAKEREVAQARSSRVACRGRSTELCAWLTMDDCPQANRRLRTMAGGNRPSGKSTMYVLICLPQCVMPLSVYHLSFITSAHFSHAVEWVCVRTYLSVYARVLGFSTEHEHWARSPFYDRIMLDQRWPGTSRRRCCSQP